MSQQPLKRKPLPSLSAREKGIVDIVREYTRTNGYAPTVQEITDLSGLSSVGSMIKYLDNIERKGFIARQKYKKRGIVLIKEACPHCGQELPAPAEHPEDIGKENRW